MISADPCPTRDVPEKNSNIQEVSQHSESRTLDTRDLRRKLRSRRSCSVSRSPERNPSVFSRIRRDRSESPRHRTEGRRDGGVFNKLGGKGKSVSAHSESNYHSYHSRRVDPAQKKRYHEGTSSRDIEAFSENEDSRGGHWKSRSKKAKSSIEEDELSQPWVYEEIYPFTHRIRYFGLSKKSRMPNNVKTYDGSDDPEDHLKNFQAAAKVEHWAMPTWCHMFNSTLTRSARVWFDDLPPESIDSYDDLKKAFLANYLQQKKCIKDPVEIHHIKQREGKSTEDFVQRFKAKSRHVKGVPECMRISGFMHGITNPELTRRLHDNILKSVDEMMWVTTTFLRGEVAVSNQARKKTLSAWKQHEVGRKQNFDRIRDFRNQQRSERSRDKFTLFTKSPKEILALDKGKFKALPLLGSVPEPFTSVAEVPSASALQVLRRLGSIFTSVYAAVQKLKKDSWLELQFSLADNSKLNVNKFEGDNTPIVIQPPCYSASKIPRDQQPPMTTPVEKRNNNKFCEFHGEVGHTDECMHLKRQIKELIKNGKLSHVIKELKHGSEKDQPKAAKKGETSRKDKPLAILMVQPWQRIAKQKITQSFSPSLVISFPPLRDERWGGRPDNH
ncbi:reverse transcriptase domain-containing protein [Tanacetum coccineum]